MIYWLIFIALEIARHYRIIEVKKERPSYISSFFFRAFFAIVCLALTYDTFDPFVNFFEFTPYMIFQLTSFWILFDLGLNLVRRKPILYNGENSGWLDDVDEVFSIQAYYLLKLVAIITMFYTISVLLKN